MISHQQSTGSLICVSNMCQQRVVATPQLCVCMVVAVLAGSVSQQKWCVVACSESTFTHHAGSLKHRQMLV
jgi:hypothetical protein